jgi:hypothetical protein
VDSHTGGRKGLKVAQKPTPGPERKPAPPPKPPDAEGPFVISARIVDQDTQEPLSGVDFEILDPAGAVVKKDKTDWQGTVHHQVKERGTYTIKVVGPAGFDEGSLTIVQKARPAFDAASLTIIQKGRPAFDPGSLTIVEKPRPGPPGFDTASLRIS